MSVIPDGFTGRWLAAPTACCRGGEGRERLSGVLYVRLCPSPSSGRSARASREAPATTTRAETWTLQQPTTPAARSRRTPYGLFQQQRGVRKVWRNAVSVPAPDQPAVCLQQPAGSAADRGLLVRSDAPARRLLQLRHRWVTGYINRFTVVN